MSASVDRAAHMALTALFNELCDASDQVAERRLAELRVRHPEQARQLQQLLAADRQPTDYLDEVGGAALIARQLSGLILDERWRLKEIVGRGGGGEVWRGTDLSTGDDVAVKIIKPTLLDSPRELRRFRREFRALSQLQHQNCLRALGEGALGEDHVLAGRPRRFIVTEWVSGGTLETLFGAPNEALVDILIQLASALDYVHRQQIVHRDLKPSNVLVTRHTPPTVKLADFGIVKLREHADTEQTEAGSLIGTLDYLSPEQARGKSADPRSDIYAFGCIMHFLWAGSVPFQGTRMERLWSRAHHDATPLAERAPHAPHELCALADAMLRRDPDHRPQSAYDILLRLREIQAAPDLSNQEGAPRQPAGPAYGGFIYDAGLVGRDNEMAALTTHAGEVRRGSGPALLATIGHAGVGKTSLVEAFSARLRAEGWLLVSAQMRREGPGPFAPFPAIMARVSAFHDAASGFDDTAVLTTDRRAESDFLQAQRRHAENIVAALSELQSEQPICILIEDFHFAGTGAYGVLEQLLTAAGKAALSLLILVTARPEVTADITALRGAQILPLRPLADDDAEKLVARMLGTPVPSLPNILRQTLVTEARGYPLLLRTAVQNLVHTKALYRDKGGWQFRAGSSPDQAIASLLDERLASLQATTADILSSAALIGVRFDADLLMDATGIGEQDLADALSDGVAAAVLCADEDTDAGLDVYRFTHARLAELLVKGLGDSDAARRHDAIAKALVLRGDGSAAQLAHHYGKGSDCSLAVTHLRVAADEANRARDASAAARQLAQLCRRLEEVPGQAAARRLAAAREELADALIISGGYDAAASLLRGLEAEATSRHDRGRLLSKRGQTLLRTAHPGDGVRALHGAVVLLGDRRQATRAGRLVRMTWDVLTGVVAHFFPAFKPRPDLIALGSAHRELAVMYRWIDLYDSTAHLARFYRLANRRAPAEFRVDAHAMASMLFSLISVPSAGKFLQERAREYATASGDIVGLARLNIIQGACEALLNDNANALKRIDRGVALAQESGDRWLLCFCLSGRAWIRGIVGSVPQTYEEFDEAATLAEEIGAVWLRADAQCGKMLTGVVSGKVSEARSIGRELLCSDVRLSFPVFEQLAVEGLAAVALVRGRFGDAVTGFQRAHELLVRHRIREGWGRLLPMERIEAVCCLADRAGESALPELLPTLRGARHELKRMGRLPLYRGYPAIAGGVIQARRGRADRARALFDAGKAARGSGRQSYMDTWPVVRSALERVHLGDDRDEIAVELDAVNAGYGELGLYGMQQWLNIVRGIHQL